MLKMGMISAVVLVKNEEKNITGCIESLLWCDEIVVVDDKSSDKTLEIVENLKNEKIKIFTHSLENNFSAQRNFGLEKATGEWVLFVDADERVTNELMKEIVNLTKSNDRGQQLNGYFVKRVDFMWGRSLKHGEVANTKLLRLAKRNFGKWKGRVHEEWKVVGKVRQLNNPLFHYPHKTIAEFLKKINFYTDLRVQELFNQRIKAHCWSIVVYPLGKFFLNYFLRRGFLDGIQGFILAIMMSFHSFLVRGKLWLLQNRNHYQRRNKWPY